MFSFIRSWDIPSAQYVYGLVQNDTFGHRCKFIFLLKLFITLFDLGVQYAQQEHFIHGIILFQFYIIFIVYIRSTIMHWWCISGKHNKAIQFLDAFILMYFRSAQLSFVISYRYVWFFVLLICFLSWMNDGWNLVVWIHVLVLCTNMKCTLDIHLLMTCAPPIMKKI